MNIRDSILLPLQGWLAYLGVGIRAALTTGWWEDVSSSKEQLIRILTDGLLATRWLLVIPQAVMVMPLRAFSMVVKIAAHRIVQHTTEPVLPRFTRPDLFVGSSSLTNGSGLN